MPSGRTRYRVVAGPLLAAVLAWSCAASALADDQHGQPLATERVSSLDDFTPLKSITVHFGNGKNTVSRSQKAQLQQLASEAQGVREYMIQVATYTPGVGSEPDTQKLSMERASAVTVILRQSGVPLANLIVSAATDLSEQTAPNTGSKEQAQNGRTVITLLQNKDIAR
jgi:outer membrane protein OmpA-like peptidoglycan-associated protein